MKLQQSAIIYAAFVACLIFTNVQADEGSVAPDDTLSGVSNSPVIEQPLVIKPVPTSTYRPTVDDDDSAGRIEISDTESVFVASEPLVINPFAGRVGHDSSVPEPETESFGGEIAEHLLSVLEGPVHPLADSVSLILGIQHDETETNLHGYSIPLQPIPRRPDLLLEIGESFLAPGWLEQGVVIPTGAVWRPSFWMFGTYRTGINYFDNQSTTNVTEWANRLDLFGQLNLTGTERVLVGIRPLDDERVNQRRFTGYDFRNGRSIDAWNVNVQTLFFEGDFGEIFPNIDPFDALAQDYGFSVGRQPMSFQQGLLVNEDMIDAVTVTRNTLYGNGILNLRATGVYAWNEINRNNNQPDNDAQLVGIFTETDTKTSTINADIVYVNSQSAHGSLLNVAISGIRRFHGTHNTYNSSLHFLTSIPTDGETQASGQGELLFSQLSWTPHGSNDLIYLNSFWAIDQFTSAARGTLAGGPLGQTGVLFAAAGLGNYGAPLCNQASEVVGASLGYQLFFSDTKRQMTFELAGRQDTNGLNDAAVAGGCRYQQALNQHWLMVFDTFLAKRESRNLSPGVRMEMQLKF